MASSRARARSSGGEHAQYSWKTSPDSVFHSDGRLAEGPLALCEVQAYVYAARLGAARIARSLGEVPRAIALVEAAQALQARFNATYWCPDIETYALALDGDKQPCRVRSSNAGHSLFTGIAHAERARQIIAGLGDEHFFSGWGVRTVAESELRFNPMSYHNGSVWPHDNSLIAAGAARYDDKAFALRILNSQFEAARHFDLLRLRRNSSAASSAACARRPCSSRWRAPLNRAPPAPPSCSCKACSASASTRWTARSCCRIPWSPTASPRSP